MEVITDVKFDNWVKKLNDRNAASAIKVRIQRFGYGNLGDIKSVGDGVHEARIFVGKGYRLYFITEGNRTIILLCGGDKSTQKRDIAEAKELATKWRE